MDAPSSSLPTSVRIWCSEHGGRALCCVLVPLLVLTVVIIELNDDSASHDKAECVVHDVSITDCGFKLMNEGDDVDLVCYAEFECHVLWNVELSADRYTPVRTTIDERHDKNENRDTYCPEAWVNRTMEQWINQTQRYVRDSPRRGRGPTPCYWNPGDASSAVWDASRFGSRGVVIALGVILGVLALGSSICICFPCA
jgi:hypothetical protein